MADGTIPSQQQSILLGFGDWLGRFGEAIYATRAWQVYGEGPDADGRRCLHRRRGRHPQDIRFTRSQDNTVLYCHRAGLAGQHDDDPDPELQPVQHQQPGLARN